MNIRKEKSIGQSHFWRLNTGSREVVLRYNEQSRSLRVIAEENYLFFFEETGFLRSRITVNNEYNLPVAVIHFNQNGQTGLLRWDNRRIQVDLVKGKMIFSEKSTSPTSVINIEIEREVLKSCEWAALLFGCLCVQFESITHPKAEFAGLTVV
jgi:hypothetical protein